MPRRMMVQFMRCLPGFLLACVCLVHAAEPSSSRTLEQLFTRPFCWGTPPSEVTWSHDGHTLAFLWNAEGQPFLDLYAYNPDTRKLLRLTDLAHSPAADPEQDERLKRNQLPDTGLTSFALSQDGRRAAVTLQGDLYLVAVDASAPAVRFTRTKAAEVSPQFSPDGTKLTYLRGGQLFAQDFATGQTVQISDADNIASYKWSPDGKRILYTTRAAGSRQLLLPIYSGRTVTARPFARNLAGDEPGLSKLFTIAAEGAAKPQELKPGPWGAKVWPQAPPQWSPDGKYLAQTVTHPDLKREQVLLLDAQTGKTRVLHETKDAAWANGMALGWSPDSKSLWFTSDESGFQHLYKLPLAAGAKATQITTGNWEIHREQTLYPQDPQWIGGWLYYTSTEAGTAERQFYRIQPDGSEKQRLSEGEGIRVGLQSNDGLHTAVLSASLTSPLELAVDGALVTKRRSEAFSQYNWPATRFFSYPSRGDQKPVAGKMLLPPLYKRGDKKKWPAIFFVHGSGYATSVLKQWGSYQEYRYVFNAWLANHGYVVFDVDYRGSSGYGRDWRTGVSLDMGGADLDDVLGAVDYARSLGNIDMRRCGIWGVSYGGFMTDMALFRAPGTFRAGVAFASVTDWENYNAFYTEQRLNRPQDNPEAYRRSSPITFAAELRDPLLIVHGMADSNVLFQDDVQLTEKLVRFNNPNFSEIFYPEENHGFAREESLTDSFRRTALFFDQNLRAK